MAVCELKYARIASPGGQPEAETRGDDVVIEIIRPLFELCRIDDAEARGDAEQIEIADKGRSVRFERIVEIEKLDLKRFAVRQQQVVAVAFAARSDEQIIGFAQQRAILARAIRDGGHRHLAEDGRRQFSLERRENGEFFRRRRAGRHHRRILEIGCRTVIKPVHDVAIGPLEVETLFQRFADVLELVATDVEEPGLRSKRQLVRQRLAFHTAVICRRKAILRRPDCGREFFAERENAGLEGLKGDFAIGKIFVTDATEIVLPDIDRQVLCPQ